MARQRVVKTAGASRPPSFVVVVKRSDIQMEVYGPYRSFKKAEGDAQAWGGSVEPLLRQGSMP